MPSALVIFSRLPMLRARLQLQRSSDHRRCGICGVYFSFSRGVAGGANVSNALRLQVALRRGLLLAPGSRVCKVCATPSAALLFIAIFFFFFKSHLTRRRALQSVSRDGGRGLDGAHWQPRVVPEPPRPPEQAEQAQELLLLADGLDGTYWLVEEESQPSSSSSESDAAAPKKRQKMGRPPGPPYEELGEAKAAPTVRPAQAEALHLVLEEARSTIDDLRTRLIVAQEDLSEWAGQAAERLAEELERRSTGGKFRIQCLQDDDLALQRILRVPSWTEFQKLVNELQLDGHNAFGTGELDAENLVAMALLHLRQATTYRLLASLFFGNVSADSNVAHHVTTMFKRMAAALYDKHVKFLSADEIRLHHTSAQFAADLPGAVAVVDGTYHYSGAPSAPGTPRVGRRRVLLRRPQAAMSSAMPSTATTSTRTS